MSNFQQLETIKYEMALNQTSDNSVMGDTGSDAVPADGTGMASPSSAHVHQLTLLGVVQLDPWLSPFKDALRSRYSHAQKWIKTINDTEGGLEKFSRVSTCSHVWWLSLIVV